MIRPIVIGAILSQRGDAISPTERDVTSVSTPPTQLVNYGTLFQELILPPTVTATLDDNSLATLPVSWAEGAYDPLVADDYVLDGTLFLPVGITNSTNIIAHITITVRAFTPYDVFGSPDGDDVTGDGTELLPFETIERCKTEAIALGGQRVIKLSAGEFTLSSFQDWPDNVGIHGEGILETSIKGDASLNYSADLSAGDYGLTKYLFQITAASPTTVVQSFRDFNIDGDSRAKHGAFYANNMNGLEFANLSIRNFNVGGVYFNNTDGLRIIDCTFVDSSHSTSSLSTGCVMFGNNTNTLISGVQITEGRGFGIKSFVPSGQPTITGLRLLNCSVSVAPTRLYDSTLSNVAVELRNGFFADVEISTNFFNNTFAFVPSTSQAANYLSNARTLYFHDNTCDLFIYANNVGYALEIGAHNIEIADNEFRGGKNPIWNTIVVGQPARDNWYVYGNAFFAQYSTTPLGMLRTTNNALNNLRVYNNTFHITDGSTPFAAYIIMSENGQVNFNWDFKNNLVYDETTIDASGANGGANELIRLNGGGSVTNLTVSYNDIYGMPEGSIVGGTYSNNLFVDPMLEEFGSIPEPYYRPLQGSPLVNAGINVGIPYSGSAPTIGAYELGPVTANNITAVDTQDNIIVPEGIPFASLILPVTVEVTLSDTSVINLAVTWAPGIYDEDVQGIYPLVGTLTLPVGITNSQSLTALVNVVVSPSLVIWTDSFDRTVLGSSYTTENITPVLDGSNMQFDNTSLFSFTKRILLDTSIVGISDIKITTIIQVVQQSTTSYGQGIGIQNDVDPNPNKGILASFYLSSNSDQGTLGIYQGTSTTNDNGWSLQQLSTTTIPVAVGNTYELDFERRVVGSDAVFVAIATNLVTGASVSVTWTEIGAGSLVFEDTSKVAIYHFGGLQQVNNLTVQNLAIASPFPNIVSVEDVAPITQPNGTAFASLGLPAILEVTLNDETTDDYDINWEEGNFSPTTASVYNLVGTIILPPSITNSDNVVATSAVTIQAPTVSTTFDRYVDGVAGSDTTGNGSIGNPYKTIQRGVNDLTAGMSLAVRGGPPGTPIIYRETITIPNSGTTGNPITIAQYPGEEAVVSGFNLVSTGWTNHTGNIYKTTITLPITGFDNNPAYDPYRSNIVANQIIQDGVMQVQARWPKIGVGISTSTLLTRSTYKELDWTQGYGTTSLTDASLPLVAPGLNGAEFIGSGWFSQDTRPINNHSGNTIYWSSPIWTTVGSGNWPRQRYYVTNKLALLTQAGEWHYEGGIFYFWQVGGGSPSGTIEYKSRVFGFDARNRSNITIAGLTFTGCTPIITSEGAASANIIIDNTRATYMEHYLVHPRLEWQGVGMAKQFGSKLLGDNCVFKNNEWHYSAGTVLWVGNNALVENNLIHDIGYAGYWGNGVSLWGTTSGQTITRNTIYNTGRSSFDFGYNFGNPPGTSFHYNVTVSYNDFSHFGCISRDLGGTYTWGQCDLFGFNYHHNWIHDSNSQTHPGSYSGIQTAIYFDQATGPGRVHHNVTWNCQDADVYHETINNIRPAGSVWTHPDTRIDFYNNTFDQASPSVTSYRSYIDNPLDVQRNNIYKLPISVGAYLGGYNGNTSNSILSTTNPLFVGGSISTPQIYYQLQAGSPARNIGVNNYAGATGLITDANLDAGAYPYGVTPWIPGYVPVPYYIEEPVDPGSVDITSIDTSVPDFDVAYAAPFGTNGAGISLPQTIDVTYDDLSTGTLGVTWSGTYTPNVPFYSDATYTLTGTPVLTGDVTNTGNLTLSVDVTVKDAFFPLASGIAAIWDTTGLVTNTDNAYGTVNVSGGITKLKSLAPGPTGRDIVSFGTAPTLSGGRAVFNSTGGFEQSPVNTDFEPFFYHATPGDHKWSFIGDYNLTDNNGYQLLIGSNGFSFGFNGFVIGSYSAGTSNVLFEFTSGGGAEALANNFNNFFTYGANEIVSLRVDNSLAAAAGKIRAWNGQTVFNATSTGSGVFDNTPPQELPLQVGSGGGDALIVSGSIKFVCLLYGIESDAVWAKFQSDVSVYTGTAL